MPISTKAILGTLILVLLVGAGYAFAISGKFMVMGPVATTTPDGITSTPPTTSIPSSGTISLALNQSGTVGDVTITPLSLEEDSRCPSDVQCIQAGTVRVKVQIVSGLGTATQILKLRESMTTEAESITFSAAAPGKVSTVTIGKNDYRFTFTVAKRTAQTTSIKIALLNTTGTGTGKARGCDNITMVTRTVSATSAPLTAAMQALFAEPAGTEPSQAYNFIARTSSTLKFDHATIANGTAKVYVTGSLSGLAGVCDDPRAQIQIEETALQFPTVQKVEIYLNNKLTTLTPNEKGE
jgi:hypothetical protein